MKKVKRYTSPWRPHDKTPAHLHIADAVEDTFPELVFSGAFHSYTSMDMGKGINSKALVMFALAWLVPLILLDRRGGHFTQEQMLDALVVLTRERSMKEALTTFIEKDAKARKFEFYSLRDTPPAQQ